MYSVRICLLLFCLLIWSCFDKTTSHLLKIDVNIEEIKPANLSAIAQSVNKIQLETTQSSLIQNIMRVVPSDSFIFVLDYSPRILQFDNRGKFIRQIGSLGKGPGEFQYLTGATIDHERKRIYANVNSKIICYDFAGNLIHEIKILFAEYIEYYDGNLWVFNTSFGSKAGDKYLNKTVLLKMSDNGALLDSFIIKRIQTSGVTGAINGYPQYLSASNKGLFLYYPVLTSEPVIRDTLYELKNRALIPRVKFNISNYSVNDNGIPGLKLTNIYRSSRFLFTDFETRNGRFSACFDEKAKNLVFLTDSICDDVYNSGNVKLFPLDLNRNIFGYYKINEEPVKLEGVGTSEQNQKIFMVQLKE